MNKQKKSDYAFSFESSLLSPVIFEMLLDVRCWWSGLYAEEIQGESKDLNDEFTFRAGGGVHYSRQRMIDLIPDKKIAWRVIESDLSFLEKPGEWTNTIFDFEVSAHGDTTRVTFTHRGLGPEMECYKSCSSAWTGYMQNLAKRLK